MSISPCCIYSQQETAYYFTVCTIPGSSIYCTSKHTRTLTLHEHNEPNSVAFQIDHHEFLMFSKEYITQPSWVGL